MSAKAGLAAMRGAAVMCAKASGLSPAETDVLEMVSIGCSNIEIAEDLGIKPRTVKYHMRSICRKLATSRRVELVVEVARYALARPSRAELELREGIIDVLCGDSEPLARLRLAINEAREPHEHPEDRCEECQECFAPWHTTPERWEAVTGRSWGGPILCQSCFARRDVTP